MARGAYRPENTHFPLGHHSDTENVNSRVPVGVPSLVMTYPYRNNANLVHHGPLLTESNTTALEVAEDPADLEVEMIIEDRVQTM